MPIFDTDGTLLGESNVMKSTKKVLGDVWNEVYRCIGLGENDVNDLNDL